MAFTNFDIVYALTQGGPGTATTLVTYFTWVESFKKLNFGAGSALAVIIALASLVVILVLMRAMPEGRAGGGAAVSKRVARCAGHHLRGSVAAGGLLVRAVRAGRRLAASARR